MDAHLAVTLTRAYNRRPVAVLHNLPGRDAELHPEQLRVLAAALIAAAQAAEAAAHDGQSALALAAGIQAEFVLDTTSMSGAAQAGLTASASFGSPIQTSAQAARA